jgi:hypothetical protein
VALGFVFLFLAIVELAAIVNAFFRSVAERFLVGAIGGAVRVLCLLVAGVGSVRFAFHHMAASNTPLPAVEALAVLIGTILGPIVTFVVLWVAHRRRKDAPAAEEEQLARPFDAWFPVGLLDAGFVLINVLAYVGGRVS